ncbi:HTH-type transcriptional regulator DmlR [Croceibacterium atlanticum]|uniref:HTH-type transcriptional regulator DmlR n=2 Tax=Croceibacterium atlanticum TaxID=1267766 RepID=A0A0F7KV67_9SPHN|nr:HTH-type transcriptional regulator DmlR [Croceibacterium atlanticum]
MDRLEAMTILLRVVDTGSFSAASRALGVPLPTVSRKVGELEDHLGTRLLARTTRKLAVTEAGAAYIASARRILEEVDEAERLASGEFQVPRGTLVLTAPVHFGQRHVLPVVNEFLSAYPEINVRLVLTNSNLHLLDDHVDIALRIGHLPDSMMKAVRIGGMRIVVCASPRLIAAHGEPKRPEELADMPIVNFEFLHPSAVWPFRPAGDRASVDVPTMPRLNVSTSEGAVEGAIAHVGATRVLHYQCADAVRKGDLRLLLEDFESEPLPVHLLHSGNGPLPTKMRVFLDFAASRLRQALHQPGAGA